MGKALGSRPFKGILKKNSGVDTYAGVLPEQRDGVAEPHGALGQLAPVDLCQVMGTFQ